VAAKKKAKKGKGKPNWIKGAIGERGGLHESLGIAKGEKIPAEKVEEAAKKGGKVGKQARLAKTLKKMKKK